MKTTLNYRTDLKQIFESKVTNRQELFKNCHLVIENQPISFDAFAKKHIPKNLVQNVVIKTKKVHSNRFQPAHDTFYN